MAAIFYQSQQNVREKIILVSPQLIWRSVCSGVCAWVECNWMIKVFNMFSAHWMVKWIALKLIYDELQSPLFRIWMRECEHLLVFVCIESGATGIITVFYRFDALYALFNVKASIHSKIDFSWQKKTSTSCVFIILQLEECLRKKMRHRYTSSNKKLMQ